MIKKAQKHPIKLIMKFIYNNNYQISIYYKKRLTNKFKFKNKINMVKSKNDNQHLLALI